MHFKATKEWNGLVGDLIQDKADVIVAPFSFTQERSLVIDYMLPFHYDSFYFFIR